MFPTPASNLEWLCHIFGTLPLCICLFSICDTDLCPCPRPCHIFGRLTRAEIGPENRRRAENADVVARLQLKVTFFASTQLAKTDDYNADGDGRKIRSKSDIFCATPAHCSTSGCSALNSAYLLSRYPAKHLRLKNAN